LVPSSLLHKGYWVEVNRPGSGVAISPPGGTRTRYSRVGPHCEWQIDDVKWLSSSETAQRSAKFAVPPFLHLQP